MEYIFFKKKLTPHTAEPSNFNILYSSLFSLKQSEIVKTEAISLGSISSDGEKLEMSVKEVPVVHTETKTITYESSEVRNYSKDLEPNIIHAEILKDERVAYRRPSTINYPDSGLQILS